METKYYTLVYPGDDIAFKLRQFRSKRQLFLFAAKLNIRHDEIAVINGKIDCSHPSYIDTRRIVEDVTDTDITKYLPEGWSDDEL